MIENARNGEAKCRNIVTNAGNREKTQLTPLRNEAQLNCVSLRSELDDEVTCGAIKGQDERSLRGALDSPASHHRTSPHLGKQLIRKAATSALTLMTYS
jgi:hypothetical protein